MNKLRRKWRILKRGGAKTASRGEIREEQIEME